MKRYRPILTFILYIVFILSAAEVLYYTSMESTAHEADDLHINLITDSRDYQDNHLNSTFEQLRFRAESQPFNLYATLIFALAILHTLFAHTFNVISENMRLRNLEKGKEIIDSFGVEIMRFMGEVEVIFGIWIIPLSLVMTYFYNWRTVINYMTHLDYTEPLFVVVIMTLASTRPIVRLAEDWLTYIAKLGKGSITSWWWTILTIGPLAGSLITEPGAMTLSALILSRHFYRYKPSNAFAYATLGLLFVNISVGGVFTSFAAPPVLMVSDPWGWDSLFMIKNFGCKALAGILIANTGYFLIFKKELQRMQTYRDKHHSEEKREEVFEKKIPYWITIINMIFLAWTVVHNHYPVIFIGSFLLFIGFQRATLFYQHNLNLKPPVLVGFFLAGLIVHGNLQSWWIPPVLSNASSDLLLGLSSVLTAFTDNAEITYLTTLIPNFSDAQKYAVLAGAISGGGLTVIANAPNPLGQSLLSKFFDRGISAAGLFIAALIPTFIMLACFHFIRPFN